MSKNPHTSSPLQGNVRDDECPTTGDDEKSGMDESLVAQTSIPFGPKSVRGLVAGGPRPGAYDIRRRPRGEIPSWHPDREDDDDDEGEDTLGWNQDSGTGQQSVTMMNRDEEQAQTGDNDVGGAHCTIFTAELARTPQEHILIQGVATSDPKLKRVCLLVGFVLLFSVVALAAALITNRLTSSGSSSEKNNASNDPFPRNESPDPTMAPTPFRGNMNWTIGDALLYDSTEGQYVYLTTGGQLFLETLNRIDTNYTLFMASKEASFLEGLDLSSLVSKLVLSEWDGHVIDILGGYTVEGQVLEVKDMYDGMVLTSVSGYPISIQLEPYFQMNKNNISTTQRNVHYLNGVIHSFLRYPVPVVQWIGKSMFDVLLETNILRNDDITGFMELIDASPDAKSLLVRRGDMNGKTLFIPTNAALATLDSVAFDPAAVTKFLLNHIISGNFSRRVWQLRQKSANASNIEVRLPSEGELELVLEINPHVIINGGAKVIQGDIFSEDGVVHIIDQPLVLVQQS